MQNFNLVKNEAYKPGFQQEWTPFSYILGFFASPQRKATLILFYTVFALTLWAYLPRSERLLVPDETGTVVTLTQMIPEGESLTFSERLVNLLLNSQQILGVFVLFGIIPALIVKLVFRQKLSDYGFSLGIPRRVRNLSLMLLPFVVLGLYIGGKSPVFLKAYPFDPWILGGYSTIREGWVFLLIYFAMYVFLYYVSWEFFFRGFIQIGTGETVGCFNAVLIGTIASTTIHFGPCAMIETIGAIGGGILWGFFVYRSRSIIPGFVMHAMLGVCLDFFLLYHLLPKL